MLKIENMWGQLLILYKVCGVKKIRKNWESAGTQRGFKKKKKKIIKLKTCPCRFPHIMNYIKCTRIMEYGRYIHFIM